MSHQLLDHKARILQDLARVKSRPVRCESCERALEAALVELELVITENQRPDDLGR